jgi:hypothetical protein
MRSTTPLFGKVRVKIDKFQDELSLLITLIQAKQGRTAGLLKGRLFWLVLVESRKIAFSG